MQTPNGSRQPKSTKNYIRGYMDAKDGIRSQSSHPYYLKGYDARRKEEGKSNVRAN